MIPFLLVSVFLVATCGLIYELIAGAVASYLLGDSVLQFSTIIGTYLFAMGVGTFLARYLQRGLLASFVQIQILVGLLGGSSAALLFFVFSYGQFFRPVLYGLVFVIGVLVGLEIPILLRILKEHMPFRDLVSGVLALDYVGALAASILFPLFLVPYMGLMRTSFFFGCINVGVALLFALRFQSEGRWKGLIAEAAFVLMLLATGFIAADWLTGKAEEALYAEPVVFSAQSPYQRVALTSSEGTARLFLNGNLQFSSDDEYRYHEALVLPPLMAHPRPRRALVLGGGDGLAVQLLLRDPRVEEIVLVELDPLMIQLFRDHEELSRLNDRALRDPRVRVVVSDAFTWLAETEQMFDLAVVDFPDPSNYSVGKLYTDHFYRRLAARLGPDGVASIQCSSPFYAQQSFWSIVGTLELAGFQVRPYHAFVPSFGEWGFSLASKGPPVLSRELPIATRFLGLEAIDAMFSFPLDMERIEAEPNRLFDQVLVRYFQDEWGRQRGRGAG